MPPANLFRHTRPLRWKNAKPTIRQPSATLFRIGVVAPAGLSAACPAR
jgi:hypothetical protein